jgi:hypothetical protein
MTRVQRQIYGIICFQHMRDALNAADVLAEAGFDTEILWEAIDDYSDAGFMKVTRYADTAALDDDVLDDPALDAFRDRVDALVGPFDGLLDECGFGDWSFPSPHESHSP